MEVKLEKFESIHEITEDGLKLIQNSHGFKFGTDAVLLSKFVTLKKGETVLDFCSGSGIIPLMLYTQNKAKSITGLEIDEEIVNTANKTVKLNGIESAVDFVCGDIKNASKIFKHSFDVITCNPPYSRSGSGKMSEASQIARARYEVDCTLEDVARSVAKVLRYGGRFYMVHKAERIADIVYICRKYKLEPKQIRFVHTAPGKNAELVLVCSVLGGGVEAKVLPPIILNGG